MEVINDGAKHSRANEKCFAKRALLLTLALVLLVVGAALAISMPIVGWKNFEIDGENAKLLAIVTILSFIGLLLLLPGYYLMRRALYLYGHLDDWKEKSPELTPPPQLTAEQRLAIQQTQQRENQLRQLQLQQQQQEEQQQYQQQEQQQQGDQLRQQQQQQLNTPQLAQSLANPSDSLRSISLANASRRSTTTQPRPDTTTSRNRRSTVTTLGDGQRRASKVDTARSMPNVQ